MTVKNVLPTTLIVALAVSIFYWTFFSGKAVQTPVVQINGLNQVQAFILPVSQANYLPIRNYDITEPETDAKAAAVFDIRSEKFLYSKNISQRLPIASITKMMTAVVIMENLALNDIFTVIPENINVDGKGADLVPGERIRGVDLFKIMLIKSSNDAALTFASSAKNQGIDLIGLMNEKARMLGMNDTKFADPSGLSDSDTFSTASDLVKLVRYVDKYPIIWETLVIRSADVSSVDSNTKHHLINTNKLLDQMTNILGGKTGYTDGALETMMMEVAINNGRDRLISVVLGSNDRFGETQKLVDWSLTAYKWK